MSALRRFSVHPELRHLRPSELVALIRSGGADVLPFKDDDGRIVVIPAATYVAEPDDMITYISNLLGEQ